MSLGKVKLGSCVDLVMGQAPPGEACNKNGEGTIFVKAGEFQERSPAIREWTSLPLKLAKAGDTLVCVVGATSGKVNFATFDCAIGRSVAAVRPIPNRIDPLYLYHFLQTSTGELRNRSQGAAQGVVTQEMLQSLTLILPPLSEQRRIAAILDQADALRAKRREALAQLDQLQQAIFTQMFGDPVRGDGRYPLTKIEEIASPEKYSIVDGPFGSSMKPGDYREFGIPVVRIGNLTKEGDFTSKNLLYIDKELFEKLRRSSVKASDVLVSRVGTIGNTCVFPDGIGDALLSTTGVCKITPDRSRMLPDFLHQAILHPSFQDQIHKSASTSVQKYFNLSALKSWKIVAPPVSAQVAFVEKLSSIKQMKAAYRKSLGELDNLFASLQHRAFRGEL